MEEFESKIRERIDKLIQKEGLSQTEFAKKVGVNSANLNQVILGKRHVQKNLPSKIVAAFPEVRIDWILYGEGEMYKCDQHLVDKTAVREYMAKLPTRPRLPKNVEGDIELYYKGPNRKLCQERPVVYNFADYDFSVILKSNRMIPKFEPGDELFFKETDFSKFLKDEDGSSEPEWGDEFLLDTKNGLRFKRIYPAKDKNGKDCFRCVSYNKDEYPDFLVSKDLVRAIYRYVGALRVK